MAFDIAPHWNSIQPWKVQMPTSIHRNLTNIHCTRWEQTQLHNNIPIGKFLTVQGLRLHTSNADSNDLIPGLGTKIPYASQCGQIERNKEINNNNKKECAYYCCLLARSCPTLCDPMDYSPMRLLYPWNFSGKNTGVGCHLLFQGIFPM